MKKKGKHFAPETPKTSKKNKKSKLNLIYIIYIICIIIIGLSLILLTLYNLDSYSNSIDSMINELSTEPTESMNMRIMLWTDDGLVDVTPTTTPTTDSTSPTTTPTQQISIRPTNPIIETQNDKIETQNEEVGDKVDNEAEDTGSVNNETRQYLLDIDNPDYTYDPMIIHLQDDDRALAAKIIMREFGDGGYEACCLQAQALRDAMIYSRSSLEQIYHFFQYDKYPLLKIPNRDCYNAIDYVFESGGLAVPHRVLVMYNPQHAKSDWHESQEFVIEYQGVRYFDMV